MLEPRLLLSTDVLGTSIDPDVGRVVAYVTVPSQKSGSTFVSGGVYRTTDRGETWQWAMGPGINTTIGQQPWGSSDIDQYYYLGQAEDYPDIIYVNNKGTGYDPPYHYTVYRSTNAGATWDDVFFNDPRFVENNTEVGWLFWAFNRGWGGDALGFGVNPGDPNELLYTNAGEIFGTFDGGTSWQQLYSQYAPGQPAPSTTSPGRWTSIGLEDTSCWYYVFDPFDPNRTYICYTDIGFARSIDRGDTWYSSSKGIDWSNTIYQIAFDPAVPGRIYAAASNQHDIPQWLQIAGATGTGGLAVSNDYGATWTSLHNGLPSAPVTTVLIDPTSPVGSRTIYAGVYGYGVYKSTNGGQSWTNMSQGITPEANRQVYSLKRTDDGALYVSVAGRRPTGSMTSPLLGGLYKSTDGAQTWTCISSSQMYRTCDFAIDPTNSNIIYVAAMGGSGYSGGIYKTVNGGASWQRLVPNYDPNVLSYFEAFNVTLNPQNPSIVYCFSNTHGLFISYNGGATWTTSTPENSPPFLNVQRITWDPQDPSMVYLTTFGGGVWKGPDPAFVPLNQPNPLAVQQQNWSSVGLGGGGGFFYPAASPHDPNLIFVSSDMGGMYRSADGGQTWRMLDWRLGNNQSGSLVFHPTDPNRIYALPFQQNSGRLEMSVDAGLTWQVVGGSNPPWISDKLIAMAIDEGNPNLMLVSGQNGLYRSTNGGTTWAKVNGAPTGLLGLYVDQTSPVASRVVLAANANAPYCSDNGGLTWVQKSNGLPAGGGIRGFSAGSDPLPVVLATEVNGGQAQRSTIDSISFQFSENVSASLDVADLTLYNQSSGAFVSLGPLSSQDLTYDPTTNRATWNLTPLALADGQYTATLLGAGILDPTGHRLDGNGDGLGGDNRLLTFFRMQCDADGNGKVDSGDLAIWQANYDPLGLRADTPALGDWDGNGRIDSADLALWQRHYNPQGSFSALEVQPQPVDGPLLNEALPSTAAAMAPVTPLAPETGSLEQATPAGRVEATSTAAPAVWRASTPERARIALAAVTPGMAGVHVRTSAANSSRSRFVHSARVRKAAPEDLMVDLLAVGVPVPLLGL